VKAPLATVAWREREKAASHVCSLRAEEGGFELAGAGDAELGGERVEVRFIVRVDGAWATRHTDVRAGGRSATIRADELGGWSVEGTDRGDLQGCTDVDLGFTPATNTLPVRRLGLSIGQSAQIEAAWVLFPSLSVERAVQRYERLGERRYRYSSGTFSVELDVDEHGLVLDYPPYWMRRPVSDR
jgi:uncharacterized protein